MKHTPTTETLSTSPTAQPFLSDVKTLRERARSSIEGGVVTSTYQGEVTTTIEILQAVLATELVCVLRYSQHAISATGLSSEGVKAEFAQHAKEEQQHVMAVAERINQLGGAPDFDPKGLASRAASEYATGDSLVEMIRENLVAERIAVDHYRELIRFFGDRDPTTRVMIEQILGVEEEHASDMLDLLITHGDAKA
jgi:bacterioferritin